MNEILSSYSIDQIITYERQRLEQEINLIASENYVSSAVLRATGSILTNKYAEGYPGKRYYAGCGFVDLAEQKAIKYAKKLFGAEHVNVQPHAGSQANMAAYFSVLEPGDTILGMSLAAGGHLTHGHSVNFSGKVFNCIQYTVNKETELLDYDQIEALAQKHKPKLIIAGASAYSRVIDFERFGAIAKKVGAYFMADIAHIAGLVAAGLHPNPFPHADIVTTTTHKTLRGPRGGMIMCKQELAQKIDRSIMPGMQGGPLMHVIAAKAVAFEEALKPTFMQYQKNIIRNTQIMTKAFEQNDYRIVAGGSDNHLFILDLRNKNVTGKQAEDALSRSGITVSRSCIPFDPQKPYITSGIRIGTPAITTRGMSTKEVETIVTLIDSVIQNIENPTKLKMIQQEVAHLCALFPIYPKTDSLIPTQSSLYEQTIS